MCPTPRQPDKQKSQLLIDRLKKQLASTQRTLAQLQKVLPGYLYFPKKGEYGLTIFAAALEELEKEVASFPE
ncbi:MAG: hypothetical protein J6V32_05945 [Elusimicrobiaceae bacterium]|nr:hypothetical protein [Elusimicrobiaceae bacterium]